MPEPALGGVAATWQAILRARYPEFRGLIVEVIEDTCNGVASSAQRAAPRSGLEVVAGPPSDAAMLDAERTAASAS
jgi:hypothetical protein